MTFNIQNIYTNIPVNTPNEQPLSQAPVIWDTCLLKLQSALSADDINTWIKPLHTHFSGSTLNLLAPNRYTLNYIKENLLDQIESTILAMDIGVNSVSFEIGSYGQNDASPASPSVATRNSTTTQKQSRSSPSYRNDALNANYTFATHVEGKSNQLARAAALQVGQNPGLRGYNPLCIYGGVGLGKTHLMQAAGQFILDGNAVAKVAYVSSERFVNEFIVAIRNNTMEAFKGYYRSLDALLIDDIQFFAEKTRTQEEFFHTFNTLLDGQRQIIITSDQLPQSLDKVDDRLISRLSGGLLVAIDPPDLETRVAILGKKAQEHDVDIPDEVAFFVADAVCSNVRELEGALHSIFAYSRVIKQPIDVDLVREVLKDVLRHREKQINIDNIQSTVAEYFKIRVADLCSKSRKRSVTRPRQLAMSFAKQFTNMSLPQIGDRFGGRDHTTVLHACQKIEALIESDSKTKDDHRNLQRLFDG